MQSTCGKQSDGAHFESCHSIILSRVCSLSVTSVRLKGCEGEVAARLDERWRLVTYDWENYDDGDMPYEERIAGEDD